MGDTKHLEILQSTIQRMAGNGFVIKGWGVTLLTAILGATLKDGRAAYALYGMVPIAMFWLLDGYFLALERAFRDMYRAAAELALANQDPSFDMDPAALSAKALRTAMASPALLIIYPPAIAILLLAAALSRPWFALGAVVSGHK